MAKEPDDRIFDVEKLESLEVESSQNLRSLKPSRRSKNFNPNQFDLFSQPQEKPNADTSAISTDGENADQYPLRQRDGAEDSQALADIRTQIRGKSDLETAAQESLDPESQRPDRLADESGEDGESTPGTGGDGSVEPADEAVVAGTGRAGRGRSSQLERDGRLNLAFVEENEEAKPSRDYRITAESKIGEGSLRYKAERNLDAIQLLKLIEREGRQATPEEKHKSFEQLPVSDDLFDTYMEAELDSLEDAIREANEDKGNRRIVKMLESAKKRLAKKIEDRAKRERKDNTITFEELGIDRIFVDEADIYKNLGFVTKMTRVAGLPNSTSNRSTDMHIKTRWLRDRNSGKGVVFATGTPISNTMAELYTMQRYLAPEALAKAGMVAFDVINSQQRS